jgi:uncharacterized membrane protein YhhN
MSKFWLVIVGFWLAVVAFSLLSLPTHRGDLPHPAEKPIIAALLVATLWAICFRKQIEERRISLFSLFVLMTLIMVWLAADQYFNHGENSLILNNYLGN